MEGGDLGQHRRYRDGVVIATTPNDGLYDDSTGTTGQASFTYKVCEAGTQTCSNSVTVNFPPREEQPSHFSINAASRQLPDQARRVRRQA